MKFKVLPSKFLTKKATFCTPETDEFLEVALESPAIDVMTDFKKKKAITIHSQATLMEAQKAMIRKNVHLLFVMADDDYIQGLITSEDLGGEKPLKYSHKHKMKFNDLLVEDIMTPRKNLDVLTIAQVGGSHVGDIIETLKKAERIHALVVEHREDEASDMVIRGMFSLNQIGRQLGKELHTRYFSNIHDLLMNHKEEARFC